MSKQSQRWAWARHGGRGRRGAGRAAAPPSSENTQKTGKNGGKTGKKRARYGLKRVQRQQRRLGRSGDSQAVDDAEGLERPEGLDDQPPEQPHRRRPDILSKFKLI